MFARKGGDAHNGGGGLSGGSKGRERGMKDTDRGGIGVEMKFVCSFELLDIDHASLRHQYGSRHKHVMHVYCSRHVHVHTCLPLQSLSEYGPL